MGVLAETEKELLVPAEEAGVLVVLKPVNPDDGADATYAPEETLLSAGKDRPELEPLTTRAAEEWVVAGDVEALPGVVVVTVENREEDAVPDAGLEAGALEIDGAED